MSQYLLPLTNAQKQNTVELLSLIFNHNEFLQHASKVNAAVVEETEVVMNKLILCNEAITVLFSSIKCIPKSTNVYGWLMGCLPALVEIAKTHSKTLYTNRLCQNAIMAHKDLMKGMLL